MSYIIALIAHLFSYRIARLASLGLVGFLVWGFFQQDQEEVQRAIHSAENINRTVLAGPAYAVSGDTMVIHGYGIRLYGIDGFKMSQTCQINGKREICGPLSRAHLASLIENQTVSCAVQSVDEYKRAVATCFLSDALDLNRQMVRDGYALASLDMSDVYAGDERYADINRNGAWEGYFVEPKDARVGNEAY